MSTTFEVQRAVAWSAEDAFAAWVRSDQLAGWWWPHLPGTTYEVEARPGGSYRIRNETAGIGVSGTFEDVDAPNRLLFTWLWDGDDERFPDAVEVTFTGVDGGSVVNVVHECGGDAETIANLRQGWNDVLDRLAALPGRAR